MILTTTESISGIQVDTIGLVQGTGAHAAPLTGGAAEAPTKWLDRALAAAEAHMVEEAERLGADGVVAIRYAPLSLGAGTVGVAVYGTAVKFQ